MNPKIWGPYMWFILHIISFEYPHNPTEHEKNAYRDFFQTLKYILPCKDCRKHYTKHIQQYPITPHLDSKKTLIDWLVQVHNSVNISLNKPTLTTQQMIDIYKNLEPISPFQFTKQNNSKKKQIITENNNKLNYKYKIQNEKCNKKINILYILIIILILVIFILKYIYKKNYYDY